MISSEKLMKVYKYLIMYTPNLKKDSEERECLDNVLVGIWNNKEIENRLERILIINVKTFDNYVLMTHLTIRDDDYNEDNYYKYKSKTKSFFNEDYCRMLSHFLNNLHL